VLSWHCQEAVTALSGGCHHDSVQDYCISGWESVRLAPALLGGCLGAVTRLWHDTVQD
jgi:hypothetical protein